MWSISQEVESGVGNWTGPGVVAQHLGPGSATSGQDHGWLGEWTARSSPWGLLSAARRNPETG